MARKQERGGVVRRWRRFEIDPATALDFTIRMRRLVGVGLVSALLHCGCAGSKSAAEADANRIAPSFSGSQGSHNRLIVTPEKTLVGKVTSVNLIARFVVLNFPVGRLPAVDQRLEVYRLGQKVAQVKVTGPQQDDNVVADILSGDSQVGDEVRDR